MPTRDISALYARALAAREHSAALVAHSVALKERVPSRPFRACETRHLAKPSPRRLRDLSPGIVTVPLPQRRH